MEEGPGLLSPTGVLADVELLDGTVYRGGVRMERRTPDSDQWIYHLWDAAELGDDGQPGDQLLPGVWIQPERIRTVEALTHEQADEFEKKYGLGVDLDLRMMDEDEGPTGDPSL